MDSCTRTLQQKVTGWPHHLIYSSEFALMQRDVLGWNPGIGLPLKAQIQGATKDSIREKKSHITSKNSEKDRKEKGTVGQGEKNDRKVTPVILVSFWLQLGHMMTAKLM